VLILRRCRLVGSLIGGIRETQGMLNFLPTMWITCDIEALKIQEINQANSGFSREMCGSRFFIDMASL
jgi:uncharacterized zinc-type alcohol dehydrogenase-like protein